MAHGVAGLAGFIAVVLLLAAAGGRLLGVRVSLGRALLTGFAGLVAGFVVGFLVNRHQPGQVTPLVVAAAVVATMLLTVVAELLARPGGHPRGGGPLRPWQTLRWTVRSARRYLQLTRIVARHGLAGLFRGGRAGPGAPGQLARRLRLVLEEAGPIFVKLGQVASTRTDLLPAPVTSELAKLQDHVPPAPWPRIQALLEQELGTSIGEVFEEIAHEPLASASLAQAHAARRRGGHPVILKVQRPGIEEQVTRDLEMIRRLTRRLESRAQWARGYHVAELGRGFADALAEELDFGAEARNIAAIAAAAPASATVLIPAVHTDISSRRLLVLERFDGPSVRDAGPLLDELGANRHKLARDLLSYLLNQILIQGTFHADPHPGNVLALRTGQLALIDFGSAGRLDIRQQAGLRRMLLAVAQRDPTELRESVSELATASGPDEEQLEQTLAAFMAAHLGPGMTPDAALIRDLLAVLGRTGLAFPPAIAGVFRALITLDGTLRALAPGFDIAAESQTIARQLAGQQLAPQSLRDAATGELLTLLPILRRLPYRADQISAALARGRFTANLRLFSDPRDVTVISTLVNRAVLALAGSALGGMSVILLLSRASPHVAAGLTLLQLFGCIGLFLSVTLLLRVIVEILRPHHP
jgi:ubiquinone biosynthesis protein